MNRRLAVDILMTVLMPLLMAYSLIGETFHEAAGTLMLVLFIAHHLLNRGWFRSLGKGGYSAGRALRTAVNLLLAVFMIVQPVSGIIMSKHLYTFLNIPGTAAARQIHLCAAYWGYVLMSFHAGMHLRPLARKIGKEKIRARVSAAAVTAVSAYGVFAFVRRGFSGYMFLRQQFAFYDFSEPVMRFAADYTAVMILFMTLSRLQHRKAERFVSDDEAQNTDKKYIRE